MSTGGEGPPARGANVVIGLGNADRGDDGAGLLAVARIRPRLPPGVTAVEGPGDVAALLDLWDGAKKAILVDAMHSGRSPGTIVRWERGGSDPLPRLSPTSTHGLSVGDAVGLADSLGRRPERLIVFGIEAGSMAPGAPVTPSVARAVGEVSDRILEELSGAGGPRAAAGDADA